MLTFSDRIALALLAGAVLVCLGTVVVAGGWTISAGAVALFT